MELHELKSKWGKYCNTDQLVTDMSAWFVKWGIRHSVNGICSMLDEFFTNKEELIKLFEKSDNYIGDLRIMIDTSIQRYTNRHTISDFVYKFSDKVESKKAILKTVDDKGKTLSDYVKIGKKTASVDDLLNGNFKQTDFSKWSEVFNSEGYTCESYKKYDNFTNIMSYVFRNEFSNVINERCVDNIKAYDSSMKIIKGTKTSRAFNKVCAAYGVDKLPKYNKLFAEYSDMVSESKRNIKFYISVNPLDYLSMSVGRSWSSCHYPHRGYFAGTVSYMLDKVSIISFVYDDIPTNIVDDGKIYRNMFHYKDGVLIQSRVYPQGNDGCSSLYDEFRSLMQKELAQDLGLQNNWNKCTNISITSTGKHYPDYRYNRDTNMSYVGSKQGTTSMEIGHITVCPYCGREDESLNSGNIAHTSCIM